MSICAVTMSGIHPPHPKRPANCRACGELIAPPDGHRDGATYVAEFDYTRLNRQARLVWDVLSDGKWHTLSEIAKRTNQPEASISARLRDLRKPEYGAHEIDRQRIRGGTHWYRLVLP